MKCPSCGAETQSKFCEYCGSGMMQQPKAGACPKCGGNNVTFKRERVGTATQSRSQKNVIGRGRTSQSVSQSAYRTVGLCQSCGYTWNPNGGSKSSKKTWLWVLGWICIFPIPLTILMLRKKDMKPAVKYGIIAAAWLLFFAIGSSSNGTDTPPTDVPSSTTAVVEQAAESTTEATEERNPYAEHEKTIRQFVEEFNAISSTPVTEIDFEKNHTIAYLIVDGFGKLSIKVNDHDELGFFFQLDFTNGIASLDKYENLMRDIITVFDASVDVGNKFQEANENQMTVVYLSDTITVEYQYIKDAVGIRAADTYLITLTSTDYNKR